MADFSVSFDSVARSPDSRVGADRESTECHCEQFANESSFAVHPFKVAAIFLGAACTSLFFGAKIIRYGVIGFRDGTYPLTSDKNLEGNLARLAASIIILFGAIACICGIVTLVFGYFRIRQLVG